MTTVFKLLNTDQGKSYYIQFTDSIKCEKILFKLHIKNIITLALLVTEP